MVGTIHRREQVKIEPFDPNNAFDPVTHIATEANFIKFLDCGIYDSKYIGYKVQLSNSVDYNNGIWIIADVNHDSTNTGQSNCYDLISQDCFYSTKFGSNRNWRNSTPRTWLNNTFYPGFSNDFKPHILNPKYNSQGTWYTDDHVILPSFIEVNGTTGTSSTYYDSEGTPYPIFTDNASRKKQGLGWWTRSRHIGSSSYVWYASGSMDYGSYSYSFYLAPILRVS